ncbi:MAG: methyltransferase domain-containing protein [Planctomycetota bacterium]
MRERQCDETEWIDRPDCPAEVLAASDRFMALVNRWFGGARLVRRFIADELRRRGGRPLRVLDIGSGGGDIPASVTRWAHRRDLAVTFTCLDLRPACGEAADGLERVTADILDYTPDQPHDCAVASMVLHHLSDEQIARLMGRLGELAPRLFINDLRRSWVTYAAGRVLTATWPAGVRHDALLSIRRGFRPGELRRLLERVPGVTARVRGVAFHHVVGVVEVDRRAAS